MASESQDPFGWVGDTVDGKYRIEAVVGHGGFGVVYQAQHLGFDEKVAVKCLRVPDTLEGPARDRFFQSFLAEGRLLHRLSRATTGIVQALDVGAQVSPKGIWTPYLVLEWLEGRSLETDLEERDAAGLPGRSIDEAITLLDPVARALAIAHEQGVAHRDIKPGNLFFTEVGGRTTLKVLDFGIAKVITEAASTGRAFETTGDTLQAFTAHYGAPEQFSRRYGATGPWTDVFAFALVFVELVTGRRALEGVDAHELFVASADPQHRPTLRAFDVEASEELEAALLRALDVDPKTRSRTLAEFWDEVLAATGRTANVGKNLKSDAEHRVPLRSRPESERPLDGGPSTQLSSSSQVFEEPPAPPRGRSVRPRTIVMVGVLATALGAAIAVGSVALTRRSESAAPAPSESVVASASAAPRSSGPAEVVLTRSPPRQVNAGFVPDETRFVSEFRVMHSQGALGRTLPEARALCAESGMSLCTEPQWARACAEHPDLGRTASWTLSAHPRGFVIRGGAGCHVRAIATGASSAVDRGALCCERSVAVESSNPNRTFLTATAQRLLNVEAMRNRRQTATFASLVADRVRFDDAWLNRKEMRSQMEESFQQHPDQYFVLDSCTADVRTKLPRKKGEKPKPPPPGQEGASWLAECQELRHKNGQFAVMTVEYVFGGSGKLQSIRDIKPTRPWSPP